MDTAIEAGRRNRFLAAILAVLGPAAGHIYVGVVGRSIVVAALWIATALISTSLLLLGTSRASAMLGLAAPVAVGLWMMWDARRMAGRHSDGRPPLVRWMSVLVILLAYWLVVSPLLRGRFARSWTVTSGSMEPTLIHGDRVIAASYGLASAHRNEVVAYRLRDDDGLRFIGRIVGLPSDTLAMMDWALFVNGTQAEEPFTRISEAAEESHPWMEWQAEYLADGRRGSDYTPSSGSWGPIIVPPDALFILGDHRDQSLDSRYRGFIQRSDVLGRAKRVYLSTDPETGLPRLARTGLEIR